MRSSASARLARASPQTAFALALVVSIVATAPAAHASVTLDFAFDDDVGDVQSYPVRDSMPDIDIVSVESRLAGGNVVHQVTFAGEPSTAHAYSLEIALDEDGSKALHVFTSGGSTFGSWSDEAREDGGLFDVEGAFAGRTLTFTFAASAIPSSATCYRLVVAATMFTPERGGTDAAQPAIDPCTGHAYEDDGFGSGGDGGWSDGSGDGDGEWSGGWGDGDGEWSDGMPYGDGELYNKTGPGDGDADVDGDFDGPDGSGDSGDGEDEAPVPPSGSRSESGTNPRSATTKSGGDSATKNGSATKKSPGAAAVGAVAASGLAALALARVAATRRRER